MKWGSGSPYKLLSLLSLSRFVPLLAQDPVRTAIYYYHCRPVLSFPGTNSFTRRLFGLHGIVAEGGTWQEPIGPPPISQLESSLQKTRTRKTPSHWSPKRRHPRIPEVDSPALISPLPVERETEMRNRRELLSLSTVISLVHLSRRTQ